MRRKDNTENLKGVIERLLRAYGLEEKYLEAGIINKWEELLGPAVAKRTEQLFIRKRVLYVRLNSAPLKQELSYGKSKIVAMLNEDVGKSILDEVVFL